MSPKIKKMLGITSFVIVAIFGIWFYINYYFVFGEGVKAGELNYLVHKGYFFKTYEGKMIQSGLRSQSVGSVQSYEFSFSVNNKQVADSLMRCSGKELELHYKEYLGVLPWRGVSKYVVDEIISVKERR